jgi:uncharacterized protein YndB with AHSA1/START domain
MAINISIINIAASKQRVWDTITKPELVKLWQYGSEIKTDWEVGSDIRFRTEWQGEVFEQWGKILEFETGEFVRYNLFAPRPGLEDKPENYFIMSYVLTQIGENETQLEIIQNDERPTAKQEDQQGSENPVLQMLKSVAED